MSRTRRFRSRPYRCVQTEPENIDLDYKTLLVANCDIASEQLFDQFNKLPDVLGYRNIKLYRMLLKQTWLQKDLVPKVTMDGFSYEGNGSVMDRCWDRSSSVPFMSNER